MSIPGFQDFMLPVLKLAGSKNELKTGEYYQALADQFGLTDDERRVLIPSGRQAQYKNRIAWAVTHLAKAGLIARPARGTIALTDRGRTVLSRNPRSIDLKFLEQFDGSREFRNLDVAIQGSQHVPRNENVTVAEDSALPPDEQLLQSYRQLRRSLSQDLLDRIKAAPPEFFEQLVVDLLVAMGYGGSHEDAGQAIGKSGDGGIDGIIKEDRLGLDFVYIQAKRWENVVGRPHIQGFAGSLEGQRARKGVFITTSSFSAQAHDYVALIEKRIVLIDGDELAELMLDYGIGVTEVASYKVQRIDVDYFGEE